MDPARWFSGYPRYVNGPYQLDVREPCGLLVTRPPPAALVYDVPALRALRAMD